MRPFALVLLVAALAGCSEDEAGPTSCPSVEGTFRGVWTERQGGTCGPVDARTIVIGDQGTSEGLPSAFVCEEPVTSESADHCNVSVLTKCATKDGAESCREVPQLGVALGQRDEVRTEAGNLGIVEVSGNGGAGHPAIHANLAEHAKPP